MKRKKRITRLAGKAGALLLVLVLLLTCSPLTAFASNGSADAQTAGAEAASGGGI